ncbi:MAG: hypothetical protein LUD41_08200 [Phascolarctobacterium sp.]|nr:hypothetical protein [Phascolarctobacterium sp.]
MVESEESDQKVIDAAVKGYVKELKGADTVILACIHYPFFRKEIEREFRGNVIDPALETALLAKKALKGKGLLKSSGKGKVTVRMTKDAARIWRLAERMLVEKMGIKEARI